MQQLSAARSGLVGAACCLQVVSLFRTINRIINNGMPDKSKVYANLVSTSRFQPQSKQREAVKALQYPVTGDCMSTHSSRYYGFFFAFFGMTGNGRLNNTLPGSNTAVN